jgi:hypothetical protein
MRAEVTGEFLRSTVVMACGVTPLPVFIYSTCRPNVKAPEAG